MAEYYQLDKTFLYLYLDLDLVWNKDIRNKKEYIIYKVFDLNIYIYLSLSVYLSIYLPIYRPIYLSIYIETERQIDR